MGLRDGFRWLIYGPPERQASTPVERTLSGESMVTTLERLTGTTSRGVWRRVSVREALGVPAIHRAVSLISSTTGMLSVQAFRNGVLMDDPPRLVTRPDPYETPGAFYGGTAADMAKYGEFVWWIATQDADGLASSLVRVPLRELQVEETSNRLLPRYTWGTKTGTRYSGANPNGRFVHVKYTLAEPFALRGEGPLQLCGVANSVAVESQNWAGNFYGEGGHPATVIKKAGLLSPTLLDPVTMLPDPDGVSEADALRNQVIGRPNNTTMVIDDGIESIEFKSPNTVGAQMLDARTFNNGDAAREFGIPGPLLEYAQQGSSLTYQNRTELKGQLLEMCLMPLYLEPIEQTLSDLLTRSTVARFNVKGFLRADIKTRYEVHGMAIDKGIYGPDYAQREEGIIPGDVEFAPVPFAAPASIPSPLPRFASMRDVRCEGCGRLIVRAAGAVEGFCRHCKRPVAVGGPGGEDREASRMSEVLRILAARPEPQPFTIAEGAIQVHVEVPPAQVQVAPAQVDIAPTIVGENQLAGVDAGLRALHEDGERLRDSVERLTERRRVRKLHVERDAKGRIASGIIEDMEDSA